MNVPVEDTQYEEHVLEKVEKHAGGYVIGYGAWCLSVPDVGIEPKVGDVARYYGKGIGYRVRGVAINGKAIYYRTEAEDAEKFQIDFYGLDAADWLKRWDEGRGVWSISMGGLGPGYEQCIHITAAEILRHLLEKKYDASTWEDAAIWKQVRVAIDAAILHHPTIEKLGLSGAQFGAALNLAVMFYRRGPRAVMTDERVKDRRIQVNRTFP